jgi:extracellular factor (EF) 3-hydroxypalmitic acid methyl ester biosynthesis protein
MENIIADSAAIESFVSCRYSSGQEIKAVLLHYTRFRAAFEIFIPSTILQMSEVLKDFKIILNHREVYSGRAVVSNLVNTGGAMICEVTLDDHWSNTQIAGQNSGLPLQKGFGNFLSQWQKIYKVLPEFKVVIADMRSLLSDMQLWMGQIEMEIEAASNGSREAHEKEAAHELAGPAIAAIESLGDRFEYIAGCLENDLRPAHMHFTRRNLHSLLMCSPFSHRTFHKPLGYAGDYGMVNMILKNPYEGSSLYAKVVNAWFLNQLPAQAHRNRIKFLKRKLLEEILRAMNQKRPARIFNLGCGPAHEIQEFLAESAFSDHARFTLLDFNEETIQYTSRLLQDGIKRFDRRTTIEMRKKTVQQLLKEAMRWAKNPTTEQYDFIYCAGLFDYLPDSVCKQLVEVFYQLLAPKGLLLVTNVDATRPFRHKLEFILDWNLIYRTAQELYAFKPDNAPDEACLIQSDLTSVNVFLEVRKPANA